MEIVDPPKSPSSGGEITSIFHPAGKLAAGLLRMSALCLTPRVNGIELMHMPQPTEGIFPVEGLGAAARSADEMREVFASSTFCIERHASAEEATVDTKAATRLTALHIQHRRRAFHFKTSRQLETSNLQEHPMFQYVEYKRC
jgi:hypothetical protein